MPITANELESASSLFREERRPARSFVLRIPGPEGDTALTAQARGSKG